MTNVKQLFRTTSYYNVDQWDIYNSVTCLKSQPGINAMHASPHPVLLVAFTFPQFKMETISSHKGTHLNKHITVTHLISVHDR